MGPRVGLLRLGASCVCGGGGGGAMFELSAKEVDED